MARRIVYQLVAPMEKTLGIAQGRKLLEQGNRTPIVYITAFDDPRARAEAQDLGSAGYFRKTDAGIDILETVRRVTARPAST